MESLFVDRIKWFIILTIAIVYQVGAQPSNQIQLANQYYINGDYQKAAVIYEQLAKTPKNIPDIHTNYFNVLLSINDFKTAEKYVKRVLKLYPGNIYYKIDRGILLQAVGETSNAEKSYEELIDQIRGNDFLVRTAAQYMISKQLTNYALKTYLEARKVSKKDSQYALEIANAYRILGMKDQMIDEYLKFASLRKSNLRYVKNILQNQLQKESDISDFKKILIDNIQKHPNQPMYGDLLVWVNVQQKDFYSAFIQARALDRRYRENGVRLMNLGRMALENNSYEDAITIFTYYVDKYPEGRNYIAARRNIIKAREEKIKNHHPVSIEAIRKLSVDYGKLIDELGFNTQTAEAYRSKALLHAFYLSEKDSAISILNSIITAPRIRETQAQSKLDLGDIFLLKGESWESTLLYSQVEKSFKSSQEGYLAKLKNAKLNYYMGNFELAKSHLDILKLATTREIANDAISLSLLITDNTTLDSSDFVMKEYASVELLLFQNQSDQAKENYLHMLQSYPGHTLTDEILWQLSQIEIQQGEFDQAIEYLEAINTAHAEDIWGDDAMFTLAEIHEKYLDDQETAKNMYRDFLTTYPGSVYVAEARKRFRVLRGDLIY